MKKLVCLSLASIFILAGCGKKDKEEVEVVVKPKYVVTQEIQERELSETFKSDAVLVPETKVDHTTDKGGTIKEIYKSNGETVKKGELVMRLSDVATEGTYNSTKSQFESARNKYNKFKKLYNEELISYLEFVDYENAYESAKANFDTAEDNYNKLFRTADVDGIVSNLFGKIGNEVEGNSTIFTVIDDKTMETYIGFPAEWLTEIKVGGKIEIEVPDVRKTLEGKILEINPTAENDTKKFKVKLGLDNKDGLVKDGMYSYVTVPVGTTKSLSVPDKSVFVRDLLNYIFIVEEGVAKRVQVTVGGNDKVYTAIESKDIELGDKVVVDGIFGLEDGAKVEESVK